MVCHNDLTREESKVRHITPMGIFLKVSAISLVPTCFRNEISAASRLPTNHHKVIQGLLCFEQKLCYLRFHSTSKNAPMPVVLRHMCPFCFCIFHAFSKQYIRRDKKGGGRGHVQQHRFRQRCLRLCIIDCFFSTSRNLKKPQRGGEEFKLLLNYNTFAKNVLGSIDNDPYKSDFFAAKLVVYTLRLTILLV